MTKDIFKGYRPAGKSVILTLLAVVTLFGSCFWNRKHTRETEDEITVLVYMAADNNLSRYTGVNVNQMKFVSLFFPKRANLVVYVDKADTVPFLIKIKDNSVDTVRVYQEMNSADASTLSMVINDVKTLFKAKSYGLLLWSHGMGWVPLTQLHNVASVMGYAPSRDASDSPSPLYDRHPEVRDMFAPDTKGFGFEPIPSFGTAYSSMEVEDLVGAIPDGMFEFIIFDTCYMGCVELLYALRHKARWIVSSPCEILGQGFPYHELTVDIMNSDILSVCKKFFSYYDNQTGFNRFGAISLVDCSVLDELADCFSEIVKQVGEYPALDGNSIQYLDRFWRGHVFFDMLDLTEHLCSDRELIEKFRILTKKCIPYAASTPYIFQGDRDEIEIGRFCGLSMYFPFEKNDSLNRDYRKLEWSIRTGY